MHDKGGEKAFFQNDLNLKATFVYFINTYYAISMLKDSSHAPT
jgi:hypothetical protein